MHLWVVKTLEPLPHPQGAARLMRAGLVARLAAARGHRVTWWNSRFDRLTGAGRDPAEVAAARALGIEVELLRGPAYRRAISLRRFLHDLATALDFARRTRRRPPPDVIYCCMPPIELTMATVAYARRHGIPVAVDIRDIWPDLWRELAPSRLRPLARMATVPYRQGLGWALARADALFACGERALAWALARAGRGRRERDAVFPHAVPVDPLPAAIRREAAAFWEARGLSRARGPGERLRLVFAGTLSERSGCLDFLHHFLALPAEVRRGIRVIIAGRGDQAAAIAALAAREPALLWVDWLDQGRLRALYERCDVGLAPYRRTCETGWILVNKFGEYLVHGLPVLTSLAGEVAAFIRRHGCGLVWEPERPDQLAECLKILTDPQRRAPLQAAAVRAGQGFRADQVYPRLLARLEQLVHARQNPTPQARPHPARMAPSAP